MAKINSDTLLRGDYLLLQNAATNKRICGSLQPPTTLLFVPLPLPSPESAPVECIPM